MTQDSSPTETEISTARSDRDFEKSDEIENHNERQSSQDVPEEVAELAPPAREVYVPPNGGYGWVCVACCFFINAHTWGINSSYGVFLANYLANDVFPGATYLDFAFVGGLSISQAMLVSPVATIVVGRFGTRSCLFTGVFLETLALVGASFAKEFWQLLLSQGLCFGYGMGFLFVGSVGIIPQWFTTRRSLANATGAAGSGLGGLMYSLATQAIIQRVSLGWAFRILGICSGAVNMTCALLIRDRHKHIGSRHLAFDYTLLKRVEFWLVQGYGFFTMLGYIVLLFSLPNYANYIGLTAKQGSVIGAVLNLGQGIGRPPIGYWSDAFGRINMAGTMTFMSGLFALVIWTFATSYGV
jgi:MFS family permease